ncbi:tyrosine-type recombinase/integrase [Sporolactobacillus pectinivorans]|uniref:tyrosine-type recombinase/integrase n=1 Tax=Sporolactobacillus pectinivorans TaxID=1591408 RepID=UPI001EFC9CE0|nr:tyrosine-type recombinase/integrase [Sporolactobacillus pectinivorans]
MQEQIDDFLTELSNEHRLSANTLDAYRSDLKQYAYFLDEKAGFTVWAKVTEIVAANYLYWLKDIGNSSATIARKAASIRNFHHFLCRNHFADTDPTITMEVPKIKIQPPKVLTIEEVKTLLNAADQKSDTGKRDRAMLELLYATGMRVSELIRLDIHDLNLNLGFVSCKGTRGKERIIPIGVPSQKALAIYITAVRNKQQIDSGEQPLFFNRQKKRLTRQGVWKILKQNATLGGIRTPLSPETLRQTLAAHLLERGADLESVEELMGREKTLAARRFPGRAKRPLRDIYSRFHPRATM